jgi:NADH-quinone oxidoreductase subunit J
MIGAIVLTLRERKTSRHQNIRVQTARTVAETLEMLSVSVGAGVRETGILRPRVAEPDQSATEPAGENHHGH